MSFSVPALSSDLSHEFESLLQPQLAKSAPDVLNRYTDFMLQTIAQSQSPLITSDRANYLSGNSASIAATIGDLPVVQAPIPADPLAKRLPSNLTTSEAAFVNAFDAATIEHRTVKGFSRFCDRMTSLLLSDTTPEALFPAIGYGTYKECYDAYEGWVAKFAIAENNSDTERYVYEAAGRAGFGDLFVETIYLTLPKAIPNTLLLKSAPFVTLILQRAALPIIGEYTKGVTLDGWPISQDWLCAHQIESLGWAEDVVLTYGGAYLKAFIHFIEQYSLCDMHKDNLGYLDGHPVVFDWMSGLSSSFSSSP